MRRIIAITAISAVAAFTSPALSAQKVIKPFGLTFGAPLSTAKPTKKVEAGTWIVKPPLPSSLFESYRVEATAQTGICAVTAIARPQNAALSMDKTYEAYDATLAALKGKYGPPSFEDEPRKSKGGKSNSIGYPIDKPDLPYAWWLAENGQNVRVLLAVTSREAVVISYTSILTKECRDIINAHESRNAKRGL